MKRRDFLLRSSMLTSALPLASLHARVQNKVERPKNSYTIFDAIVVGVGSMGSSTCYYLAKQGYQVLGLEQFDIPHELGSHAGQSRIIRKAYFEHPDYVPLLEAAYKNWKDLESETGAQLYFKTGLLYFGQKESPLIKGLRLSAEKYKVPVESIDEQRIRERFSHFNIPDGYEKLFEPDAGFLPPEKSILLYVERALHLGATIRSKERILAWNKSGDTITVKTNRDTYQCKRLILTSGPWTKKMIPALEKNLNVTRQMIAWMQPKTWKKFELGQFPCWTIADHDGKGIFYGFPILPVDRFGGPIGLKLAHHYHGAVSDPDHIDRVPTYEDERVLTDALRKFIPDGYSSTLAMKTCMYTNTPDENFILDFLPGYDTSVVVAAGFSGHGFKFASVVGEIMTDLAMKGTTQRPIGFLSAKRFLM